MKSLKLSHKWKKGENWLGVEIEVDWNSIPEDVRSKSNESANEIMRIWAIRSLKKAIEQMEGNF